MNKIHTGLYIPVCKYQDSELIAINTPGSLGKQRFRIITFALVGFLISGLMICIYAKSMPWTVRLPCLLVNLLFMFGIFVGMHYEEILIHRRVRRLPTVELAVVITDNYDGLSICTGTISEAIESDDYFILTTSRKGNKTYAYIAPKCEMTEGEMNGLRRIILYQIPNHILNSYTKRRNLL